MCVPYPSSEEVTAYDATPLASVPWYWICSADGVEAVALLEYGPRLPAESVARTR